jgi:hypothetical protein
MLEVKTSRGFMSIKKRLQSPRVLATFDDQVGAQSELMNYPTRI